MKALTPIFGYQGIAVLSTEGCVVVEAAISGWHLLSQESRKLTPGDGHSKVDSLYPEDEDMKEIWQRGSCTLAGCK
jgi:hypothetical protein